MTYRVHQLNKKTGVTYVYEATAVWGKEKKQPRNKQVCIILWRIWGSIWKHSYNLSGI